MEIFKKLYRNPIHFIGIAFLSIMALFSCQKVVDINLNAVPKQNVIEAEITNQPGPFSFKITKTVNYDEENNFPAISGAVVKVSDNNGNTETLTETAPGIYTATVIQGVPGRTYYLDISFEGKEYHAESTMPQTVNFDTLLNVIDVSFGDTFRYVNAIFLDPVGVDNYYRFVTFHNDTLLKTIIIANDQFMDGNYIPVGIYDYKINFEIGDTLKVVMQCIDKNVFEYFKTLSTLGGYSETASPANPTTNINNSALGYFSATSTQTKIIVIE